MSKQIPLSPAEQPNHPPPPERRRAVRFECQRNNTWRLFATVTSYSGKGIVHDISERGISLVVDSLLRPGMFLDLSLENADDLSYSRPMLVRVRRVTAQADGSWIVGCSFVKKLTDEELRDLALSD